MVLMPTRNLDLLIGTSLLKYLGNSDVDVVVAMICKNGWTKKRIIRKLFTFTPFIQTSALCWNTTLTTNESNLLCFRTSSVWETHDQPTTHFAKSAAWMIRFLRTTKNSTRASTSAPQSGRGSFKLLYGYLPSGPVLMGILEEEEEEIKESVFSSYHGALESSNDSVNQTSLNATPASGCK